MDVNMVYLSIVTGLLAIVGAIAIAIWVAGRPSGPKRVREISTEIQKGAITFLNKEYEVLIVFVIAVMAILLVGEMMDKIVTFSWLAFGLGALFSAAAGNVGMRVATMANGRTTTAVEKSQSDGLIVAFSSGAVMGLIVCGLGLIGVALMLLVVTNGAGDDTFKNIDALFAFGFGASSIALFARLGGGIYTKSADVGADLVGKVEAGIPEDDPRNPAVIADNVGDNVGDVAGMGADLFESYVDAIIAAMALGASAIIASDKSDGVMGERLIANVSVDGEALVILPLLLTATGIFASIIGVAAVYMLRSTKGPRFALTGGTVMAALVMSLLSVLVIWLFVGEMKWELYIALISGLVSGVAIGFATDYFTSEGRAPTRSISKAATTGAGTVVIAGLSVGMLSTVIPVATICVAIIVANHYAGVYGIALSAMGMLSTLGITLSIDCYGPVADNAAGIAELAGRPQETRERAEELDAVGNTTAAMGKGFAIGSAALAALALFSSYQTMSGVDSIDIMEAEVTVGLFIGALMPIIFSALAMNSVGKAAISIVNEVRRQFREIPGLMEGTGKPDTEKCVGIATRAALREMVLPTLLVIVMPIAVGLWSLEALGGFLAGSLVSGLLLAIFMANAGGAWDNAKKYIESGEHGGKGSDAHKAAVVGDTVGDPLKDTAGPSLNILIKLMSIVALVFLPFFV